MCKIVAIITFFIAYNSYSQTSQDTLQFRTLSSAEYTERYEKLKGLYIKQLDSESFKKSRQLLKEFNEKVNWDGTYEDAEHMINTVGTENPIIKWISNNIEKTEFKDFAEAEAEYKIYSEANALMMEDNKEFFDYLRETFKLSGSGIFANVIVDVRLSYPEKFSY